MSTKVWKVQELPDLCPPHVVSEAEIFVTAIANKIDRILFLIERLNINENWTFNLVSNAFLKTQIEVEIYVESIASNLHSLADILAQLINVIVLKPLLAEAQYLRSREISIGKIREKLLALRSSLDTVRRQYIEQIVHGIDKLCNSSEYSYISAFVNIIKHRRLLNTKFHFQRSQGSLIELGFKLNSFDYEGTTFPEILCQDIATNYREKILDLVFEVGSNVNDYCRAVSIMAV